MPKAILFGAIGTLVETSDLQRQAFNKVFAEAGLNWFWGPDHYAELLCQSGGKRRIERFAADRGERVDAEALQARKSEIFHSLLAEGVDLRPGVADVISAAKAGDVPLGFVTTTGKNNVHAILSAAGLAPSAFAFIGYRDLVPETKPAPDIYRLALSALDVPAGDALAIEDSPTSARSALAAGVPTIAFPGRYLTREDFGAVVATVDRLDPAEMDLTAATVA